MTATDNIDLPIYINKQTALNQKYFQFHDKQYPIDFDLIKKNCHYFYENRKEYKNVTVINLLTNEENELDISDESVEVFIKCCHNEPTQIRLPSVISLHYLSTKFEYKELNQITSQFITQHSNQLIFEKILFHEHLLKTENRQNMFFDTSKEEEYISGHMKQFINNEKVTLLPISVLDRILTLYFTNNGPEEKVEMSEINNFLIRCLDKFGRKASILFRHIDFQQENIGFINVLFLKYSEQMDFSMINKTLAKTTIELARRLELEKEKNAQIFEKMSETIEKQKNQIESMKNEIEKKESIDDFNRKQSKIAFSQKIERIQKEAESRLKIIEDKFESMQNAQKEMVDKAIIQKYQLITLKFLKVDEFKKLGFDLKKFIVDEFVKNHESIKIEESSNDKESFIQRFLFCKKMFDELKIGNQIKQTMTLNEFVDENLNEIKINENQIDYLNNRGLLNEIIDGIIKKFDGSFIEIKYPSNSFNTVIQFDKYLTESNKFSLAIESNEYFNHHFQINKYVCKIKVILNEINEKFDFKNLMHLELNEGTKIIGDNAFSRCTSLVQISIPSSVTSFGTNVFQGVKSLTITGNITSIPDKLFKECTSLTKVSIPQSVISIGDCAFSGCASLVQISIPSSVTSFGNNVFQGVKSLTITGCITSIPDNLFKECTSLTKVSIPPSVTSIGHCAFYKCTSLFEVSIPSSVISIGDCAFSGCKSLNKLEIPSSIEYIGFYSFADCPFVNKIADLSIREKINQIINIDDYEIKEFIIKRSFAYVFRAIKKKTGKEYALKFYDSDCFDDNVKFQTGIDVSRIEIPGIIKTQSFRFPLPDIVKSDANILKSWNITRNEQKVSVDLTGYIISTEFMKNGDIFELTQEYLRSNGSNNTKMNPTIRSKIIFGIAATMKQLHKRNIIHRNLKLQKILLDDNLEPRIASFEFAAFVTNSNKIKNTIGTPQYMAPETFLDKYETYSFPVDVYSYSIFLYCMFTNNIEFANKRPIKIHTKFMIKIGQGDRPKRPDSIPDCYWELIQRCWKQNPEDRPTFKEIVDLLKDDKYAIEEFGMKTDLDQLHEYQKRIDID